eukprot:scaffold310717_cov15-Tisochrysis_lutea.AAC.1
MCETRWLPDSSLRDFSIQVEKPLVNYSTAIAAAVHLAHLGSPVPLPYYLLSAAEKDSAKKSPGAEQLNRAATR